MLVRYACQILKSALSSHQSRAVITHSEAVLTEVTVVRPRLDKLWKLSLLLEVDAPYEEVTIVFVDDSFQVVMRQEKNN